MLTFEELKAALGKEAENFSEPELHLLSVFADYVYKDWFDSKGKEIGTKNGKINYA